MSDNAALFTKGIQALGRGVPCTAVRALQRNEAVAFDVAMRCRHALVLR